MQYLILVSLVATALAAPPSPFRGTEGSDKIIGGTDVPPGGLPYMLSYQYPSGEGYAHWCGASLIAPTLAITARHCLWGDYDNPQNQYLLAGDSDRRVEETSEQRRSVSKIIPHPTEDIAILIVSTQFNYNEYVQNILLPESKETFTGIGIASGWGKHTLESGLSYVLQKLDAPLYPNDECRERWWGPNFKESELCAGGIEGEGFCHGDSGGPLACYGHLCGVVSYCGGCARGIPDVYMQVSWFVDWIKENVDV